MTWTEMMPGVYVGIPRTLPVYERVAQAAVNAATRTRTPAAIASADDARRLLQCSAALAPLAKRYEVDGEDDGETAEEVERKAAEAARIKARVTLHDRTDEDREAALLALYADGQLRSSHRAGREANIGHDTVERVCLALVAAGKLRKVEATRGMYYQIATEGGA
jgi:hypothetical protein